MKKLILAVVAMVAITFTSCSNDQETQDTSANLSRGTASTLALCSYTDDSVVVTRSAAPSSTYSNWVSVPYNIGGDLDIEFEGIYGGGIRPSDPSENWYIGVVDSTLVCSANWATLRTSIQVKNASSNVGSSPSTFTNSQYNVVGYNGSLSGYSFGLGYYSYDILTHIMTPQTAIVIWKDDNGAGDPTYESDPADATKAYVIKVQGITPGASSSTVDFKFTQIY